MFLPAAVSGDSFFLVWNKMFAFYGDKRVLCKQAENGACPLHLITNRGWWRDFSVFLQPSIFPACCLPLVHDALCTAAWGHLPPKSSEISSSKDWAAVQHWSGPRRPQQRFSLRRGQQAMASFQKPSSSCLFSNLLSPCLPPCFPSLYLSF